MTAVTPELVDACREEFPARMGLHELDLVAVDVTAGVVGGTFRLITWSEGRRAIEDVVEQHVALLRLPEVVAPGIARVAGLRLALGPPDARIARHFAALAHAAPARFAAALADGWPPTPAAALIEEEV